MTSATELPGAVILAATGAVEQVLAAEQTGDVKTARALLSDVLDGGCCYALHAPGAGAVKLGKTNNLLSRWQTLQTASPESLRLAAMWRADDPAVTESELHGRFAAHRRPAGEWFNAGPVMAHLTTVLHASAAAGGPALEAVIAAATDPTMLYSAEERRQLAQAIARIDSLRRRALSRRDRVAAHEQRLVAAIPQRCAAVSVIPKRRRAVA